jgi:hydrogenase expression/formation protein HypC
MCLAAPARVLSISENVATVDYGGVKTQCRLDTLTEKVAVGDYVLIHTGFAIRRLSPEDGEETLKLFDELARSLTDEAPVNDLRRAAQDAPEPEPNASRSEVDEESGSGSES